MNTKEIPDFTGVAYGEKAVHDWLNQKSVYRNTHTSMQIVVIIVHAYTGIHIYTEW